MKLKIFQVDAFTSKLFSGNPAAVCPLDSWLSDDMLQNIAMENNLAETGYYVNRGDQFEIRWFTPAVEVDLCGHATLAAAYVLFNFQNFKGKEINFFSPRSGLLKVGRDGEMLTLDFPTDVFSRVELSAEIISCFNIQPTEAFKGRTDYMIVFESEEDIRNLQPDFIAIGKLKARGVIVTARGNQVDFVSRFFAPQSGINEDPVTGSAHTTLTPYWAQKTGKNELTALQLSARTGELKCTYCNERVKISGQARMYLNGEISIPD